MKVSKNFHLQGVPLLISSKLLRSRNLGQIDLARLLKTNGVWQIQIAEVKSSEMGKMQMQRSQKFRLRNAQNFLSAIFGLESRMSDVIYQHNLR